MADIAPLSARIRIEGHELFSDDQGAILGPRPVDLVLAGLGSCTVATLQRCAALHGWDLDGVYVELSIHGDSTLGAIGRRIWLDGSLTGRQLDTLRQAVDQSPVTLALTSGIDLATRVAPFPRPDLTRTR